MSNRHPPAGQNSRGGAGTMAAMDMNGGPGGFNRRKQPQGMPHYGKHYQHHQQNQHQQNHQHQQQYHQQHQQQHHQQQHQQQHYHQQQYHYPQQYHQQQHYHQSYQDQQSFQNSQNHQHHQHMLHNTSYLNLTPYNSQEPQPYYGMPPQYQNGATPSSTYVAYQPYTTAPPSVPQFVPMGGAPVPQNYHRPASQSPPFSGPYHAPLAPAAMPPHTPSSTYSDPVLTQNPPIFQMVPVVSGPVNFLTHQGGVPFGQVPVGAFRPPLPWYSEAKENFPARRKRCRKRAQPQKGVYLPVAQHGHQRNGYSQHKYQEQAHQNHQFPAPSVQHTSSPTSSAQEDLSRDVAPSTLSREPLLSSPVSRHPSWVPDATSATASAIPAATSDTTSVTSATSANPGGVSAPPAASAAPGASDLPEQVSSLAITEDKQQVPQQGEPQQQELQLVEQSGVHPADSQSPATSHLPNAGVAETNGTTTTNVPDAGEAKTNGASAVPTAPPPRAQPSTWAGLFVASTTKNSSTAPTSGGVTNGDASHIDQNSTGSFSKANANGLGEAIRSYQVGSNNKVSFLEPRGLNNTGNMCYMNSVLQVLIFCAPLYDLLDQINKRAVHRFASETPLFDSIILFMREYKVLRSAPSIDQLTRLLKSEDFERYGEPFTPEFVYDALKKVSRFSSMEHGHQQDAEEFLGFLLESLNDECTKVMGALQSASDETRSSITSNSVPSSNGWLEVGPKQRASVTQSSGHQESTPITKIFGGLLRSELKVPGLKDSITNERFQPLQLDIGAPEVRNVTDALLGLTRPERVQGDFKSPRGKDVTATKQVFIDSLPPVLILHLKRFQFDAEGTVKIWKKVEYPLELEIPREVLSRPMKQRLGPGSMPKYKLISVVYHHGKNASGGHYTVDVRRHGSEWVRLDDTVIRRVRSGEVGASGSEPDAKGSRKDGSSGEDAGDEEGWKQVPLSGKKWHGAVNGTTNGHAKEKHAKDSIKDNKVAYILFYQRL